MTPGNEAGHYDGVTSVVQGPGNTLLPGRGGHAITDVRYRLGYLVRACCSNGHTLQFGNQPCAAQVLMGREEILVGCRIDEADSCPADRCLADAVRNDRHFFPQIGSDNENGIGSLDSR